MTVSVAIFFLLFLQFSVHHNPSRLFLYGLGWDGSIRNALCSVQTPASILKFCPVYSCKRKIQVDLFSYSSWPFCFVYRSHYHRAILFGMISTIINARMSMSSLAWHLVADQGSYTCQLLLRYKCEILILGVLGFLKTTRSFLKIPEEVRSLPKTSEVCRRRSYRVPVLGHV